MNINFSAFWLIYMHTNIIIINFSFISIDIFIFSLFKFVCTTTKIYISVHLFQIPMQIRFTYWNRIENIFQTGKQFSSWSEARANKKNSLKIFFLFKTKKKVRKPFDWHIISLFTSICFAWDYSVSNSYASLLFLC